ncbi:IS21 family transposase [Fluviispira sanaruensis]|uniref:IS21 family transposase n=1 Tax=Fluviispira sanaruensis TaxID=2493639 RepID=A0A4P2W0I6_FLUSA|nr:IS21 family transposase [Fluviispira sanaruensis]BBH54682.1 IS21 family transposase [Fluviispira sanaruensis]
MISSKEEAEILRLYNIEKWRVGTIATYLKRHHTSIKRVLINYNSYDKRRSRNKTGSILDKYEEFIQETLERYPLITASRIYQMIKERGYPGLSSGLVRMKVSTLRPKKQQEAFLKLKTFAGEEGQVDWADFGKISVGKAERRLSAFVLTLSHSRMIYLRFFYSQGMREFLQGFVEAFEFFNGVPKRILLDNLRSGVRNRVSSFINYNEQFLSLSKHYCFEPQAVGVRKGNEKGKVERSIQYIRNNFFSGREFENIEKLNKEAINWCLHESPQRKWQTDNRIKIFEAFEEEKTKLIPLPKNPYFSYDRRVISIGKTPYGRYDLNDYSVPAKYVMRKLELCASENSVEIFDGINKVAEHLRSYSKQEVIENSDHISDILKHKKRAIKGSALHRITTLVPDAEYFIEILVNRGENTGGIIASLTKILNIYGKELLTEAIQEVIVHECPRLKNLYFSLNRLEAQSSQKNTPYAEIDSGKYSNLVVNHHEPSHYDKIAGIKKC